MNPDDKDIPFIYEVEPSVSDEVLLEAFKEAMEDPEDEGYNQWLKTCNFFILENKTEIEERPVYAKR